MRKLLTLASLLLIVGCSAPTMGDQEQPAEQPTEGRVFHATIGEAVGDDTRVYLDSKIRILWNEGDLITLFEGTTRNKQYIFLGEDGDNAGDFDLYKTGFGSGNAIDRYYALFPYASKTKYVYGDAEGVSDYIRYTVPSTQTYREGSIGANANIMVAMTADLDDFDLLFRNACSYLRVKLWGADQTIGSVTVSSIGGEALAGDMAITPIYGEAPECRMLGTLRSVKLDCGDGVTIGTTKESATEFWLVLPPVTLSRGMTITVTGFYGGSQTYTLETANLPLKRNTYNTVTREVTISDNGTGMGVGGWGEGSSSEGEAE